MKFQISILATMILSQSLLASDISYSKKKHAHDVFSVQQVNSSNYSYTYMPFNEWKNTATGQNFDLEPAPVLTGLVQGVTANDVAAPVDPSQYEDQAAEFAAHVNFRLEGGRPTVELPEGANPANELANKHAETHVVEMTLSALVDVPFENIELNQSTIDNLASDIDLDHYYFQIPGTLVSAAIEDSHMARQTLQTDKNYLLSVFDMRDYGCAVMRDGIDDYFSKRPAKDRLANGSIYVISDLKLNDASDLDRVTKALGKSPDAVISQKVVFADHLIRASSQYFAFYKEGSNTRIVLIANVAMGSKFFTGAKGAIIRNYLLEGIGSGVTGVALDVKDAASNVLNSILSDAEDDVSDKNSCDAGLALGLVGFSQTLFNNFYWELKN